ncbi:hypothetical protein [Chryseolinea lacunae]|uniref:Uncharacterized protein n=1 Tax=Chryseolinea lacunae TaxID=2801331 RepID=A0ABS1L2A6_9BACT|nr:hypothetical protein [Chryseolinea lacunae]MBL0745810.1 hypothetical protein [Chryseolinea lacunae]
MWDANEKTCTVYIDTSHTGKGSEWAKMQKRGNAFHYLKIEDESHYPVPDKQLVFFGDQTAIGHFCALQQLASQGMQVMGCIAFSDLKTAAAFHENCPWLPLQGVTNHGLLYHWVEDLANKIKARQENYMFYVVGNAPLVVNTRRL